MEIKPIKRGDRKRELIQIHTLIPREEYMAIDALIEPLNISRTNLIRALLEKVVSGEIKLS